MIKARKDKANGSLMLLLFQWRWIDIKYNHPRLHTLLLRRINAPLSPSFFSIRSQPTPPPPPSHPENKKQTTGDRRHSPIAVRNKSALGRGRGRTKIQLSKHWNLSAFRSLSQYPNFLGVTGTRSQSGCADTLHLASSSPIGCQCHVIKKQTVVVRAYAIV